MVSLFVSDDILPAVARNGAPTLTDEILLGVNKQEYPAGPHAKEFEAL
jgi:hypothetical protein